MRERIGPNIVAFAVHCACGRLSQRLVGIPAEHEPVNVQAVEPAWSEMVDCLPFRKLIDLIHVILHQAELHDGHLARVVCPIQIDTDTASRVGRVSNPFYSGRQSGKVGIMTVGDADGHPFKRPL